MQIAIVHYHLNRGGVTQVILNHLRSLDATAQGQAEPLRVMLLYGGRCEAWPKQAVSELAHLDILERVVPSLEYDATGPARPESLARDITTALQDSGFRPDDTVIHVHNHALGKNVSLPGATVLLARDGFALLLQVHDFAEDSRPANYRALAVALTSDEQRLGQALYPQAGGIHYAVLNARDFDILSCAGVPPQRLHKLPNPVSAVENMPDRRVACQRRASVLGLRPTQQYVLYPVRGIRRKNLGELLLWAAAGSPETCYGVTLPPINPIEIPRYEAWKQLAHSLQLQVRFETGGPDGLGFGENLAASDRIITTSLAEGFGMVFLETWLADRVLVGRDLPEITADFSAAGIRFDWLSPGVRVPIDWFEKGAFETALEAAYRRVLEAYQRPVPSPVTLAQMVQSQIRDGLLDFGQCTARLQSKVVSRVAASRTERQRLLDINPTWVQAVTINATTSGDTVQQNATVVRQSYCLEVSGQRLRQCYGQVLASSRTEPSRLSSGAAILNSLLDIARLHPVRIES